MSQGDRVEAMLRRVGDALRQRCVAGDADAILHALRASLEQRRALLGDDEHPLTLHPARTLLILLDDCDVNDAGALTAAALCETVHTELALAQPTHVQLADEGTHSLLMQIPLANDDDALERLVVAEPLARMVALAERLDYARHLHLLERGEWKPGFERTRAVYLPIAQREGGVMQRRYEWWVSMFERRYVRGGRSA